MAASDQDLDEQDSNPRSLFNLDTPSLKPASPPAPRDATAGNPPYPTLASVVRLLVTDCSRSGECQEGEEEEGRQEESCGGPRARTQPRARSIH